MQGLLDPSAAPRAALPPSGALPPRGAALPPRSLAPSAKQGGRFVAQSALPAVGQKIPEAAQSIRPAEPEHALTGLDDATYLEVLEHDILAVQSYIASQHGNRRSISSAHATPPPSAATHKFSERELRERRELGGPAAKLFLHEILSEKLKHMEWLSLVEAAVHGGSRLPRLRPRVREWGGGWIRG